jgi:hypothetical protein
MDLQGSVVQGERAKVNYPWAIQSVRLKIISKNPVFASIS